MFWLRVDASSLLVPLAPEGVWNILCSPPILCSESPCSCLGVIRPWAIQWLLVCIGVVSRSGARHTNRASKVHIMLKGRTFSALSRGSTSASTGGGGVHAHTTIERGRCPRRTVLASHAAVSTSLGGRVRMHGDGARQKPCHRDRGPSRRPHQGHGALESAHVLPAGRSHARSWAAE